MLSILLSISIVIILFISYLLFLALRRINDYENFIIQISQIVEFSASQIKKVDSSGHYESDDETNFFFEQLKEIQNLLSNIFEIETEGNTNAKTEKK